MPAPRPSRRLLLLGTAALAAFLLLAVIAAGSPTRTSTTAADRAELASQLTAHPLGSATRPFSKLTETLPNARAKDGTVLTDSVVTGVVTVVTNGQGFDETGQAPTPGKPGARILGFHDRAADWRTLRVTVRVDTVVAGPSQREVLLDWPVMGSTADGDDAAAIGRALKALGRVLVLSQALPRGPEFLGLRRQVPDRPYGLGLVGSDESLSFPFIDPADGGTIDGPTFMAGVDTLGELKAAASKPAWTRAA